MTATLIIATTLAITIMVIPAALVWFINIGGIVHALKQKNQAEEALKATF